MKKKAMIAVIFVGVLFAGLCFLSSNPIISCKIDIPENYSEAIEEQVKGVYSQRLPLVPVYVTVDSLSGSEVFYTIHYFPIGTVGMSYMETEGFNGYSIVKPLN